MQNTISLEELSYNELQDLKRQIEAAESQKLRKYTVSFEVYFQAKRPETDMDHPDSFEDSVWDIISSSYDLKGPMERLENMKVTEVDL